MTNWTLDNILDFVYHTAGALNRIERMFIDMTTWAVIDGLDLSETPMTPEDRFEATRALVIDELDRLNVKLGGQVEPRELPLPREFVMSTLRDAREKLIETTSCECSCIPRTGEVCVQCRLEELLDMLADTGDGDDDCTKRKENAI
jgi:hypothetical protein